MADWIDPTATARAFYGGVPQLIVPDDPRALICDANRYVPHANDTVHDFATHYGTSFLPARGQRVASHAKNEHKGGFTAVAAHTFAAHRPQWNEHHGA